MNRRIEAKKHKQNAALFHVLFRLTDRFLYHHPPGLEAMLCWWDAYRTHFLHLRSPHDAYGRGYNTCARKDLHDIQKSEDPVDATWWTLSYFSDRWCPSRVGRFDRIMDWWREKIDPDLVRAFKRRPLSVEEEEALQAGWDRIDKRWPSRALPRLTRKMRKLLEIP